jgi:hypothetical protein
MAFQAFLRAEANPAADARKHTASKFKFYYTREVNRCESAQADERVLAEGFLAPLGMTVPVLVSGLC